MSAEFDPYQEWLSIPPNERPANYYRLLGLPLFESNANVISNAADRQMAFVRTFQTGQYSQQSQQILNELAQARVTLLDKQKKTQYDAKLRAEQKSGSNGGIGIASSLGSYGEVQSSPPPLAASLTPPPWSNNFQGTNPGVQGHVTPPRDITVPPIQGTPNSITSFLKKNWIALLSVFVVLQLLICGGGLMVNLLKPSKTEVAQNVNIVPSSVDAQLAKRYYEQSVDLQEEENYNEALNKINIAVELEPDNELYKAQQQAIIRLIKVAETLSFKSGKEAGERKTIVVNGVEFAFRWCPAGTFQMGSPSSEKDRDGNETQHQVTLTKGFWMMETEVTVGMFKAFISETGYKSKGNAPLEWTGSTFEENWNLSWRNPGFNQTDNHPVTCVSWNDAVAFCKWLSKKTGQNILLPTEAQWEYACRAGTTGAYAGNLDEMAWYILNSGGKTHPVGTKKANAWGLYDMHGNVEEWCQDWSADYPSGSVTDPAGPSTAPRRVSRGGSYHFHAETSRSASRDHCDPYDRDINLGFRVVLGQ